MELKEILGLLDPKNQNLPRLVAGAGLAGFPVTTAPVFQGEEKTLMSKFPKFRNLKFSGKAGETLEYVGNKEVIRLVGVGPRDKWTARAARRFYGRAYLESLGNKPKKIAIVCAPEDLKNAAIGLHIAALDPGMFKSKWQKTPAPEVSLVDASYKKPGMAKPAIAEGMVIAEGKNLMRVLGSLPPNILHQKMFAELAMALGKLWKVPCKRASKKELKDYELLNAVSLGSEYDSELVIFMLEPKTKTPEATAVIGKGLCYDSGGLIGKQDFMKSMKQDMAGSASVLGAILTIVKNKWQVKERTYFVLAIAQNMMGHKAMRADDIFKTGDGQTVEIVHTDAEGRLVLADAICYLKNNFKEIKNYFTIATLTGNCLMALGDVYTGVVCNDTPLAKTVEELGLATGDLMHLAPWNLEYDDYKSPVADVPNLGENSREGGWIKGGLFMHHFIPKKKNGEDDAKFCHFDIAGTIDMHSKGKPWRRKGFNSGVGVTVLSRLLTQ